MSDYKNNYKCTLFVNTANYHKRGAQNINVVLKFCVYGHLRNIILVHQIRHQLKQTETVAL